MHLTTTVLILLAPTLSAATALPAASRLPVSAATRPGSASESLTRVQVENLVLLGKVWGFAKYHHPRITGGGLDWDAELRRIVPTVVEARDLLAARSAISDWLGAIGDPRACMPCAQPPLDPHLRPEIDWIRDQLVLGRELSGRLMRIHRNRSAAPQQHYVRRAPNVGNPMFENEPAYGSPPLPPAELRLLALFRFWNMIEYWFPYRDLIEEDRDGILREFVPKVWEAGDADAYRLAVMQLIARVHDTHANLWSSLAVRPPTGTHRLPVTIRFVEGKAVVTGYSHPLHGAASGLRMGDVITSIDGAPIDSLVVAWRPFYAASNEPTRLRDIARALPQGAPGAARIVGERNGQSFTVSVNRVRADSVDRRAGATHDLPGETFQMLADDVAYLKLSSVRAADAASYIERAAGAKVFVIDIRNYPSEFVVFALGRHLVRQPTAFARFTNGDPENPGAFTWTDPVVLQPAAPFFDGTVVILIDEVSQSQAEYTTMAFRVAPRAIVVGSTTAGADGNVSAIPLPGGLRAMITGIGVFYPDERPTQRVGIIPDLIVEPTIAGIRAGRDEVLEAGVSRALGREFRYVRLPAR